MLKIPGKEHKFRPLTKKMSLIGSGGGEEGGLAKMLGNFLNCREFLRGLGTSSFNFGDIELLNSTHLTF